MSKDKYQQQEEDAINERMQGWTVKRVTLGTNGEELFVIDLEKGSNRRSVILCGNELGAWLSPKSRGPKQKQQK